MAKKPHWDVLVANMVPFISHCEVNSFDSWPSSAVCPVFARDEQALNSIITFTGRVGSTGNDTGVHLLVPPHKQVPK